MSDDVSVRPTDVHSRLVQSPAGRAGCVLLLAVLGFWILAPNMPASPMRERVESFWQPAVNIGLAQNWAVFSPNPRSQSIEVYAVVEYDDGTVDRWDVPRFDPLAGAYRQYRWNKWQDRVRLDARNELWDPTAVWVAEQFRVGDDLPATVRLVRRWRNHEPLTEDGAVDSDWNEFEFHVWTRDG